MTIERPGERLPLDEARRRLLAVIEPCGPVGTRLADLAGLALAEDVTAPRDVPPFDASAMDGYAVRAADVAERPARLRIVGSAAAGAPFAGAVGPGAAVAIATGGAVPVGTDTVCPIEDVTLDGDVVTVPGGLERGAFVRPAGDDTAAGSIVFTAGTVVGPAHVGVLASLGITEVSAHPRPRVGVLATGDEVVDVTVEPGPGRIHDANRPALLASVAETGCVPVDLGIVPDDRGALEHALADAVRRCDVVLTSGGVSVGDADHTKAVLEVLAPGRVSWMEVWIRPGKPFGFALVGEPAVPVLCLPGNPVSSLVVFELLVRPALARRAGRPAVGRRVEPAVAGAPFGPWGDGKLHIVRVVARTDAEGTLHVVPAGPQGSHQLRVTAGANALALVEDAEPAAVGEPVRVIVTDPTSLAVEAVGVPT